MDDFILTNLYESRNEWCSRLINILTPHLINGIRSIFNVSVGMCIDNKETDKYLMTFQTLLSRIPKWNSVIIEDEKNRIVEKSGCFYLEDLITCVHIIQLKVLTSIRVGNKQKKIDINIPKLDHFIHKVYISMARKIYCNVYLFDKQASMLEVQKNNRELEKITQECILRTIQESIPTSEIIRAYLDESVEQEEVVSFEPIPKEELAKHSFVEEMPKPEELVEKEKEPEKPMVVDFDDKPSVVTFNEMDKILDDDFNNNSEVSISKIDGPVEDLEKNIISRLVEEKMSQSHNKINILGDKNLLLNDFDDLEEHTISEPNDSDKKFQLDVEELE